MLLELTPPGNNPKNLLTISQGGRIIYVGGA